MKQFQLSVFCQDGYASYRITTEDDLFFHFQLISTPDGRPAAPDAFTATGTDRGWIFSIALEPAFKRNVIRTLKKVRG